MNKILFIAPSSFPIYQPEAMVNAKHIKALTDAGCEVDLISRSQRKGFEQYPIDEGDTYFGKLKSLSSIAVDTNYDFKTIVRHILTFLKTGHVYKAADWAYDCITYCESTLNLNEYSFVYTKDYPSEIVGLYLRKKYGIKWVATWNDPYTWEKYPAPYGYGPNAKVSFMRRRLIKAIGKHCDVSIYPSARLRDYIKSYIPFRKDSKHLLMYHICEGVEASVPGRAKKLRIIHAGSIGKERNPSLLFDAIRQIKQEEPNLCDLLEIEFLGVSQRRGIDTFNLSDIKDIVTFKEPIVYSQCKEYLKDYDICMVLEAQCEEGIFLPSKVADYLQINKKIWAISPQIGCLNDLYNEGIVDYFSNNGSQLSIYSTLKQILSDFENGNYASKDKELTDFQPSHVIALHRQNSII